MTYFMIAREIDGQLESFGCPTGGHLLEQSVAYADPVIGIIYDNYNNCQLLTIVI